MGSLSQETLRLDSCRSGCRGGFSREQNVHRGSKGARLKPPLQKAFETREGCGLTAPT